MKKFLTVLLVIAVMFTFSFSSAFAVVDWTGESTSKYLTEDTDYKGTGEEGITEAYRAALTSAAKDELSDIKENTNLTTKLAGLKYTVDSKDYKITADSFWAPEKAKAIALYETYIENLKTVKTAKAAAELRSKLQVAVVALDDKYDAYDTAFTGALSSSSDGADPAVKLDFSRLNARNTKGKDYYLPGYGVIAYADAYGPTDKPVALTEETFIKEWLFDNDYRATRSEIKSGAKALVSAVVLMSDTYTDGVEAEKAAIVDEIYKYVDKDATMRNGLPISDLEGLDALVKKITAFDEKYAGLVIDGNSVVFKGDVALLTPLGDTIKGCAANYFDQYYSEVAAVPEVKKLTDADKASVIALYKKVTALLDNYEDVWTFVGIDASDLENDDYAYSFGKLLKPAYEHFLNADVEAFNKLDTFTAYKMAGDKAYFDASEKNVAALKAKRAAYDALVSNYGYDDLAGVASPAYTTAVDDEALILAAEHNMTADADYDVKDVTKLQAYLNNATLKVTTTALGNNKIRVQAKFDAETYKDIVAECGNDYTISYKFYHKTAKATTYKAAKEKDRNYITYTKKSLKKGTKYKFQCAVLIKDAAGNVVAQKDYKASTIGSRVCR